MWLYPLMFAWLITGLASIAAAEVYYWTDQEGVAHFSDAPPRGQEAKRLKMDGDCSLREEIVALPLADRANLGLWLYLGAPKLTGSHSGESSNGNQRWPMDQRQYEQEISARSLKQIKNRIIFEARQCAVGLEKACRCASSLFHDPPRGFAPEGYLPLSSAEIEARTSQLAKGSMH